MRYLIFLFMPCFLFANPHFFVDVDLAIKNDKISFDWKFDRINSTLLFFEADKNKDKNLDKFEEKQMIEKLFTPLKDDGYFVMIEQSEEVDIKPLHVRFLYIKKRVHITFDLGVKNLSDGVICNIDPVTYFAFRLKHISSDLKTNIQKDRYDFCIGVEK